MQKSIIPKFDVIFDFLIENPKWEALPALINSCLEPAKSYQGIKPPKKIYIKGYDPCFVKTFGSDIPSLNPSVYKDLINAPTDPN